MRSNVKVYLQTVNNFPTLHWLVGAYIGLCDILGSKVT